MVPRKEAAPELLAEARRLYEQTLAPVDDIAGMLGVSRSNFYRRVRDGGWRGRRARVNTFEFARALSGSAMMAIAAEPAEQPRADVVANDDPASPQQRLALALRMQRVVERQMDAVERIVDKIVPADQVEAEHGARALASVSRTLRDIRALTRPEDEAPPDATDDDAVPRDIDEFREALARRIEAFIDAERGSEGALDADAGDGSQRERSR